MSGGGGEHLAPYCSLSSVRSLNRLGRRGNMTDHSAEIFARSALQAAVMSGSGMGNDVHSLTSPIQHLLHSTPCQALRGIFSNSSWDTRRFISLLTKNGAKIG